MSKNSDAVTAMLLGQALYQPICPRGKVRPAIKVDKTERKECLNPECSEDRTIGYDYCSSKCAKRHDDIDRAKRGLKPRERK